MRQYWVIYEKANENYSAYAPDLPGCIACGDTLEETAGLMREAIELYLEALAEEGRQIPEPTVRAELLSIE